MTVVTRNILSGFLAVLSVSAKVAASDATIQGVVTDATGKPVRGAMVKVITSEKSVTRFTQKNGRYDVTVPAGSYSVAVEAFGFSVKRQTKDTARQGDLDFALTAKMDVTRLSGAELEQLVPNTPETKSLKRACIFCHDFSYVMRRRGSTAEDWRNFLPNMTRGKRPNPRFTPEQLKSYSETLEKYFGPDAPFFAPDADPPTPEQVKHADLSDEVLKATIRDFVVPTPDSFPHSIYVDPNNDEHVWFSELGMSAQKLGYFNSKTEKFTEFPMPVPNSATHTMVAGADGLLYFTVGGGGDYKLGSIDIKTGTTKAYPIKQKNPGAHTITRDQSGNIWFSSLGGRGEIMKYDVKEQAYRVYKIPSSIKTAKVEGQLSDDGNGSEPGTYDVAVDSKGGVWVDEMNYGVLVRLDPATGEAQQFKAPVTPGTIVQVRGIHVDSNDNIWFASFHEHKLGKLDPRTGKFTMYQPPTRGATPYGITEDKKTGYIWYGDMSGRVVTRFDPNTERFIEYPLPTYPGISRFISVDSDSRVWFTEYFSGRIGVLDPGDEPKKLSSR